MQRDQHQTRSERSRSQENMEEHNHSKQLIQHPARHHEDQIAAQPQNSRGAPAVRLDMDLDVELELKAKIKGDVTLAIFAKITRNPHHAHHDFEDLGESSAPSTKMTALIVSHIINAKPASLELRSNPPNTMSSQRTRRTRKSSSKRADDGLKPVEILSQVGRVALPFILTKLAQQQEEKQRQQEKERERARKPSSSRSRSRNRSVTRAPSTAGPSTTSRDKDRNRDRGRDSEGPDDTSSRNDSDLHGVISQVAVGLVAFGARKLIQRRKEAKRAAASAVQTTQANGRGAGGNMNPADAELSRALEATAVELQGASESIRRLANSRPTSHHRKCEVRDELVKDAERLEGSLASIQTGIHNMRNLHPRLHTPVERNRDNTRRGKRSVERIWGEREGQRDRLRERYREPFNTRASQMEEDGLTFGRSRRRP
ncbi:hypothetical protein B0T21DRAFT_289140 [Apiosordaria backusii]|uniref:Uncharacterized protein n=1 Tax=Apiosordaria backusii TaxID=314023 RepID=A0AA40BLI0_9PEZI|nr:hypothetical protein B0T21DRAFT_289140 [Apiosordaria backusii]